LNCVRGPPESHAPSLSPDKPAQIVWLRNPSGIIFCIVAAFSPTEASSYSLRQWLQRKSTTTKRGFSFKTYSFNLDTWKYTMLWIIEA